MNIQPVILCGGTGSRLWPLSREHLPKHLAPLLGAQSFFQETVLRALSIPNAQDPWIVTNERQRFLVAEQLHQRDVIPAGIILEPMARNTAAAVASAAFFADPEALLLVLPADHFIPDREAFAKTVSMAVPYAHSGKLVTFGITPTSPHTGYGYIQPGQSLKSDLMMSEAYAIQTFIEKPDLTRATAYVNSGFLWNSGMFLWKAKIFLEVYQQFEPNSAKALCQACQQAIRDPDFTRLEASAFTRIRDIPVDIAVMEKTHQGAVLPYRGAWSDVGSWDSLKFLETPDAQGNVLLGNVIDLNSKNCYIRAQSRLVATIGLEDLVVVETPDALLITKLEHAQQVKTIVQKLKETDRLGLL